MEAIRPVDWQLQTLPASDVQFVKLRSWSRVVEVEGRSSA